MTTITARHDSNPETVEARIYQAASTGRPVLVRVHGFDPDALTVMLDRFPKSWRIERGSSVVTIRPGTRNSEPGGAVAAGPAYMHAVTFNGYVGNPDWRRNLAALIARFRRPLVVAIQEGKRLDDADVPDGYRQSVAAGGGTDHGQNVWLIRDDVRVVDRDAIRPGGPDWTGPHGRRHPARIFPTLTVEHDGQTWNLANVHRATGHGAGNTAAREAEERALIDWFDSREGPAVALGDWNSGRDVLADLARAVDGAFSLFHVDGALWSGGVHVEKSKRSRLRFGSDAHRPIGFTFRTR